jgi:hypothetical protein
MPTRRLRRPRCSRALQVALRLACSLALVLMPACGPRLSGTWANPSGLGQFEFREDGTAYMTSFAGTIACTYELDGDHVIVKGPNGTQVLTRDGDRLDAGLGMSFIRR